LGAGENLTTFNFITGAGADAGSADCFVSTGLSRDTAAYSFERIRTPCAESARGQITISVIAIVTYAGVTLNSRPAMLLFVAPSVAARADHKCAATFHRGARELDRDVLNPHLVGHGACEWSAKVVRAASDVAMYMPPEHTPGTPGVLLEGRALKTAGNTGGRLERGGYRPMRKLSI